MSNIKIKITHFKYDGYLQAELLKLRPFLGIPFLKYWKSKMIYRNPGSEVKRKVASWQKRFGVAKENIIDLTK